MRIRKRTVAITAGALAVTGAITASCVRPMPLYGPPADSPGPTPTFQADTNIPETVYGPPEELEPAPTLKPDVNLPPPLYGPPAEPSFSPGDYIPDPLYGPPGAMIENES